MPALAVSLPPLLHCYRCIYSWRPVRPVVRMCPRCKSLYWNVPKVREPPFRGGGLGVEDILGPHRKEIARLRRKYGVRSLRVFGSVARGEAGRDSDVDLLVEYRRVTGLATQFDFRRQLESVLGRKVELGRAESLKWYVRPQALAEAVPA